ncbi:hypothetical protein CSA56_06090 [candidate division KSB3 bacterium]|uniref:Uncharacterized protein n=1 Tax=candidate division KSB3 bacterium TaxID=2044937 RepID=A0A2G6KH12_9BACT|nr:MAG: hypothetical protein CSA56_06090 [candidate division KSB3 bacterium]
MKIGEIKQQSTSLTKAEKLELIRFLSIKLLTEECDLFDPSQSYTVWSPFDEFLAAEQLHAYIHSWNE